MTNAIGGEKPVIDNSIPPAPPRHMVLAYRDNNLVVENIIRDEDTDTLLNIMTSVELVVNAMGFDVELGVNEDGNFIFYDNDLEDILDDTQEELPFDNDYEIEPVPATNLFDLILKVGAKVQIMLPEHPPYDGQKGVIVKDNITEDRNDLLDWDVKLSDGNVLSFDSHELKPIYPSVGDAVKVVRKDHSDAGAVFGMSGRVTAVIPDQPHGQDLLVRFPDSDWYVNASQVEVIV